MAFRFMPGEGFSVLTSFGDGPNRFSNSTSGLIPGMDGLLYGTCLRSLDGGGALIHIRPPGRVELVAKFLLPHGKEPGSTFFRGIDGTLYRATLNGGKADRGTVFQLM